MKRFLAVLTMLILSLAALSACGDEKTPDVALSDFTNWQSYQIIRSDTNETGKSGAIALRKGIADKTGTELTLTTDFVKRGEAAPEGTLEILVGPTNRPESESGLLAKDWEVEFEGGRLAIRGGSSAAVDAAVEWYLSECVSANGLKVPKTLKRFDGEYPWKDITIGGTPIWEFRIESDNPEFSSALKADIAERSGRTPDDDAKKSIRIVHSDETESFAAVVTLTDDGVLATTNYLDLKEAFDLLMEAISTRSTDAIDKLDSKKYIEVADFSAGKAKLDEVNKLADERIVEIRNTKSDYKAGEGGKIYYVSNKGNDMNDGLSEKTPKANPTAFDNMLKAGDVLLFERGGLWREYFKTVAGVTYSAYGEGAKPMIYASPENGADASKWTLMEGTENIWIYATEMMDVGNIIFNEGDVYGYKAIPFYKDGKYWASEDKEFDIIEGLDCDLKFFSKADSKFSGNTVPVSDTGNIGEIYLRCDKGNPGELYDSIEFLIRRNGIGLAGDNVIIDNLCVKYVGAHGIGGGTVGNVTIRNCEIGWIGGGVQYYTPSKNQIVRYGNGIEIYGGCKSYTIENCYVYDCYDAGITHQYQKGGTNAITDENVTYKNNVIERCAYNIEYFMGAVESGNADRIMRNVHITDNILREAGKSFGERPHSVDIMGWGHRNEAYNFVIENNIFANAENRIFYIGAEKEEWLPTFKNNTYIQKFGGQFALWGPLTAMKDYAYGQDFDQKIKEITGEEGAKIYYIDDVTGAWVKK